MTHKKEKNAKKNAKKIRMREKMEEKHFSSETQEEDFSSCRNIGRTRKIEGKVKEEEKKMGKKARGRK